MQEIFRAVLGGQNHAARNLALALDRKHPGRACLRYLLWLTSHNCGLVEEAVRYREQLAGMEARWPAVFWARLIQAGEKRDFFGLIRCYVGFREAFPAFPNDRVPLFITQALARGLAAENEPENAVIILKIAASLFQPAERNQIRALAQSRLGRSPIGPCYLLRPESLQAVHPEVRELPKLVREARLTAALEVCRRWREQNPKSFAAWWNSIILQLWLGRELPAQKMLEDMQEAGFSDEDVAAVWAAYFVLFRPWLESGKKQSAWKVSLSAAGWQGFVSSRFVRFIPPVRRRREGDGWREVVVFTWADPTSVPPGQSAFERPVLRVVPGLALVAPDGTAELCWVPDAGGERFRQWLEDAFGVAPVSVGAEIWGDAARELFGSPLPVRADPRGSVDFRERFRSFARAIQDHVLGEFLSTPRAELAGKSPQEAAADPRLRPRLLGFLFCLLGEYPHLFAAVDTLRRSLGLESGELIDLRNRPLESLPAVAFMRIDPQTITEKGLRWLWEKAKSVRGGTWALRALCRVFMNRPELMKNFPAGHVFGSFRLAIMEAGGPEEGESYLRCVEESTPPPHWDMPVAELLRLTYRGIWGKEDEFAQIFWEIRRKYWANNAVRAFVTNFLRNFGILEGGQMLPESLRRRASVGSQDQTGPGGEGEPSAPSSPPQTSALILPDQAAGESPDSPAGESSSSGQSAGTLWLPGDPT